jgi:hypothetical protein
MSDRTSEYRIHPYTAADATVQRLAAGAVAA